MGRWGIGNFESDTAADHVCELSSNIIQEIEDNLNTREDSGSIQLSPVWVHE